MVSSMHALPNLTVCVCVCVYACVRCRSIEPLVATSTSSVMFPSATDATAASAAAAAAAAAATRHDTTGQTFNFVVLNNILSKEFVKTTPDCVFDLKGCDFRRTTKIPSGVTFRLSNHADPVDTTTSRKLSGGGGGGVGSAIGNVIRSQVNKQRVTSIPYPVREHKPSLSATAAGGAGGMVETEGNRARSTAPRHVVDLGGVTDDNAGSPDVEQLGSARQQKAKARMSRRSSDALFVQRSNVRCVASFLCFGVAMLSMTPAPSKRRLVVFGVPVRGGQRSRHSLCFVCRLCCLYLHVWCVRACALRMLLVSARQLPLLKDGNMFLSFHVDDKHVHTKFLAMVAADAEFLSRTNIMDYSVLLGVAFHTPRETSRRIDPSALPLPEGFGTAQSKSSSWAHRLDCWAGIEVRRSAPLQAPRHATPRHATPRHATPRRQSGCFCCMLSYYTFRIVLPVALLGLGCACVRACVRACV